MKMRVARGLLFLLWAAAAAPTATAIRRELKKDPNTFKCVEKGDSVNDLHTNYDDDTVVCDDDSGEYDLSQLDPNQPPMRCEQWDPSQTDLDVLDPLYICIAWHSLYGKPPKQESTPEPTSSPTVTPTKLPTVPPPTGWATVPPPTTSPPTETTTTTTTAPPPTNQPPPPTHPPTTPPPPPPDPPMTTPPPPPPPPDTPSPDESTDMQSISMPAFSIRLVVPSTTRRLQESGVPYNREMLLEITQDHVRTYLNTKLINDQVALVHLDFATYPHVTSLQGSTVIRESMEGNIYITTTLLEDDDSMSTIPAMALQSFEGQALWEYFFRLRESGDEVLAKTQEVTLLETPETQITNDSGEESPKKFGVGVIVSLVVIAVVTLAVVTYMVVWVRRTPLLQDDDEKHKQPSDTPDTNASSQFFPEPELDEPTTFPQFTPTNDEASSLASVSFGLASIRERSLEEEEEDDDDHTGDELLMWEDDDNISDIGSELSVQSSSCRDRAASVDTATMMREGHIQAILPIEMEVETSYMTEEGAEVTRREVSSSNTTRTELNTSRQLKVTRKKKKKPTRKEPWMAWKRNNARPRPVAHNRPNDDASQCSV